MNHYIIKYQKGNDILIEEVEAENTTNIQYNFYMTHPNCDIISITLKEGE